MILIVFLASLLCSMLMFPIAFCLTLFLGGVFIRLNSLFFSRAASNHVHIALRVVSAAILLALSFVYQLCSVIINAMPTDGKKEVSFIVTIILIAFIELVIVEFFRTLLHTILCIKMAKYKNSFAGKRSFVR